MKILATYREQIFNISSGIKECQTWRQTHRDSERGKGTKRNKRGIER
jgi:hypothetical protein